MNPKLNPKLIRMKPKAQWHFYAKGNAPLRLNQSELSAMKKWLKLWGSSMWGKVQPHSHILTFDCVIVSFQSKLQKYRYQHCGYQQGGKLEAMKKRWATAIVHSRELYLLNMWDKVSLQSLRETLECQPDKGGPVIPVPSSSWPVQRTKGCRWLTAKMRHQSQ